MNDRVSLPLHQFIHHLRRHRQNPYLMNNLSHQDDQKLMTQQMVT